MFLVTTNAGYERKDDLGVAQETEDLADISTNKDKGA
jgi:hypothetical protein